MTTKTVIIAEAGVNHNGDMDLAKKLIAIAADSGADLVKFQTFNAERLVSKFAEKAEYQKNNTDVSESQFDMLRRLELSRSMHEELRDECKRRGIQFFSTAFDIQSVDVLLELGVDLFKIPSGEITNLPYLQHIGRLRKPIFLSSGMADLDEIAAALVVLEDAGTPRELVTVLHCTTEYPASMKDVNLSAMIAIRDALGVRVGYSDHTSGIEVSIAAVALGAVVIEKHFTLDRGLPGPDHRSSLEPDELKAMVRSIRNIEDAMGDGVKRCMSSEEKNRPVVRKSIVAAFSIRAGEFFSDKNLTTKRPGTGISPMRWNEIVGRRAVRDFGVDDLIEL